MSDHSGSTRFRSLFEAALREYEKKMGITLAEHPLTIQLQSCHSIESTAAVLQGQAQAFSKFRGSDRAIKSIKSTLSILTATLGDSVGLLFSPAKAIHAGLAILLDAANGVTDSYDSLVDLLESIEHFLKRLDIYTRIPSTVAMDEMVVKIMVELLTTLALATKEVKQGKSIKFMKKVFGEKDVEAVLQRLDRLTHDEARTTAAQTLAVVHSLVQGMRVAMDDGKISFDGVRQDLKILHQMAGDINKLKRDKLQHDICGWLSPPDPWKNHNIARELHQAGTAEWFIQGCTFSEWKSSGPSSVLWIHGKPGSGKSVFCSTIIDEIEALRKSGLASLAIFYYDFREDQKKDRRGLLSSMLVQLCLQSDSYYDILCNFYLEHSNGSRQPNDDAILCCLKDIVELPGQAPVFLIVDALDECPNKSALSSSRKKVLQVLKGLVDSQVQNLRICVTSRPEADIKVVLEPLSFRSVSLHDESGQKEDIKNYIKSIVSTHEKMRRWKPEHKDLVIDVLTERADGMFRWVYCQLDYLGKCLPGRIRRALDELPQTLDETYERTLREIDDANWEFARRLFLCVAVACRPLFVEELAEFLAFDFRAGCKRDACPSYLMTRARVITHDTARATSDARVITLLSQA